MQLSRLALCLGLLWAMPAQTQDFPIDNALRAERETIRTLQARLSDLNFDVGRPDGAFGPRTQRAIEAFLTRFPEDGVNGLSRETLDRVSMIHHAMFSSPFEGNRLVSPGWPRTTRVFTTDIRQLVPDCDACNATTFVLATGDLDGDGRDEIVLHQHVSDLRYRVIDRASPISIVSPGREGTDKTFPGLAIADLPHRVHVREAIIADFNNDGVGDLFAVAHGLDRNPFPGEQNILILSGPDGHRDVSATHLPQINDMAHGFATGDLTGNGALDIIVITNQGSAGHLPYLLINDGAGNFERRGLETILDPALFDFRSRTDPYEAEYSTARLIDLNGNGSLDLLLLARGELPSPSTRSARVRGSLLIYNDGTGRFPVENLVELPTDRWGDRTFTTDATAVDLDGDGALDLILTQATRDGDWQGAYLQVLMQEEGTFVDRTAERLWPQGYPQPLNRTAFAVATQVADFNGDGHPDIVSRSLDPAYKNALDEGVIQFGINDGTGHFRPVTPLWTGGGGYGGRQPVAGDFNGDGIADLASHDLNGDFGPGQDRTYGIRLNIHVPSR